MSLQTAPPDPGQPSSTQTAVQKRETKGLPAVDGSQPVPNTISHSHRSSAHSELQAIHADYYNITDSQGAPVAGLLILTDRKQRPVRAELQLHQSTSGALQELAQRQARLLISDRYHGDSPLPLAIVRTYLEQERTAIQLDPPPAASQIPSWARTAAIAVATLIIFASLGWYLNDMLDATPELASEPESTVAADSAEAEAPSGAGAAGELQLTSAEEEERVFETNGLPNSNNALPLDVGQRIRIRPPYQVALRTEAGANAGEVIGSIQSGDEATIVNGPIWREGTSDTIVWWKVRTDDGIEAWVAANTSELTLLEPVP